MTEESKGLFLIKAEYNAEICMFADIRGIGPNQYTAKMLIENMKEPLDILINPKLFKFPSIAALGYENLNDCMFSLIYNAMNTTRFGLTDRLHTGFSVINGKVDNLVNAPEDLGPDPLSENLSERIKNAEADWVTFFSFGKNETQTEGIGIDIYHPELSHLFFMPITYNHMDNGELYFCLDVTQTELIMQMNTAKAFGFDVASKSIANNNQPKVQPTQKTQQTTAKPQVQSNDKTQKVSTNSNNNTCPKSTNIPIIFIMVVVIIGVLIQILKPTS
ncbi:hypothetical protein [Shewanella marisflavi]|uniref:Uncharacterized protein n=1 Tax=Shewanella marisflavi TaxID=260364 RepID=A0AAC9XNY9_9GAMM|nr:hypothetical protein [Shewanella marisflavi]ASJ97254.1 hypothetical protein CFF01_12025 [Shewanella marisflavi]